MLNFEDFEIFLMLCNYVGTIAFAASGVIKGLRYKLDIFGVTFLGIVTACGGGIIRDVLVQEMPASLVHPQNLYISIATSIFMCIFIKKIIKDVKKKIKISNKSKLSIYKSLSTTNLIFDSLGLCAFALIGADKGVTLKINMITSGILAALTGVGGGIIRDLLVAETPIVLKEDIYAILAFFIGVFYHILVLRFKVIESLAMVILFSISFLIRILIIKYKVNLPMSDTKK